MKAKVFASTLTQNFSASVEGILSSDLAVFDSDKYAIFPGFCDVHVHFREPGFSYKETIKTGSYSAARGGYTAVCTMPNLNPVPDSVENLNLQRAIIEKMPAFTSTPTVRSLWVKRVRNWQILKAWHLWFAASPTTVGASSATR